MKNTLKVIVLVCAAAFLFASCDKNKGKYTIYYQSTVTVKKTADGGFFMKQDDTTALVSTNVSKYPFDEKTSEKRAMIIYSVNEGAKPTPIKGFKNTYSVVLSALDTIFCKQPVKTLGSAEKDAKNFGNDYMGLYLSKEIFPTTMIEDGYLMMRLAFSGSGYVAHEFNLVTGGNPANPYSIEVRHNAFDDDPLVDYTGIICFPLKSLPDTQGKTVDLTLVWNSIVSNQKDSTTFKYCSRTDWPENL